MKKFTITSLAIIVMLSLGVGTSMGKMGRFAKNLRQFSQDANFYADGTTCINDMHFQANMRHTLLKRLVRCLYQLNLSDETRSAIVTLMDDFQTSQTAQNAAMRDAMATYWEIIIAPVLDEAALTQAEDDIMALKTEDMELKFNLARAIRGLLSEEEAAQLADCFDLQRGIDAMEALEGTANPSQQ